MPLYYTGSDVIQVFTTFLSDVIQVINHIISDVIHVLFLIYLIKFSNKFFNHTTQLANLSDCTFREIFLKLNLTRETLCRVVTTSRCDLQALGRTLRATPPSCPFPSLNQLLISRQNNQARLASESESYQLA